MNKRQAQILQSLRSAQAFIDTNADALSPTVMNGTKAKLDNTIASLTTHATNQTGDHLLGMGLTRTKRTLRTTLIKKHMKPIARIARAELRDTPELEALRMPKSGLGAVRLAAHADGMARAAEPFSATFIDWGLSPNFIVELRQAASALLASIDDRTVARGNRRGATIGIKQQLRVARFAVGVLDALIKSELHDDPVLLQQWIHVSRVGRVSGRKAGLAETRESPTPVIAEPAHPITDPDRLLSVRMLGMPLSSRDGPAPVAPHEQ